MQEPVRIGIVGTGYAAKLRADAFHGDPRSQVVAVAGRTAATVAAFAQPYQATPWADWQAMVADPAIDLVVVCHVNQGHGAVVRAALTAGKAVVVEYPLALSVTVAEELITLAETTGQFLHVEHIELLGGLHQALTTHLPAIGTPLHGRYSTAMPQNPAPQKWTYAAAQFGFPLMAAVSRIHRFTNLFGPVEWVQGWVQYDDGRPEPPPDFFTTCRCGAQLHFRQGFIAEVFYGKGEQVRFPSREMVIEGTEGTLVFQGDRGELLQGETPQPIAVGGRRGLFAQDSTAVLDALLTGTPLYVTPAASLYALRVAAAVAASAHSGHPVQVE